MPGAWYNYMEDKLFLVCFLYILSRVLGTQDTQNCCCIHSIYLTKRYRALQEGAPVLSASPLLDPTGAW